MTSITSMFKAGCYNIGTAIHNNVQNPVEKFGRGIRWLTNMNEGGKLLATGIFGAITYKGIKDSFTIFTDRNHWVTVEDRFKSTRTVAPAFVNIGPSLNRVAPAELEAAREAHQQAEVVKARKEGDLQAANAAVVEPQRLYDALGLANDPNAAIPALINKIADFASHLDDLAAENALLGVWDEGINQRRIGLQDRQVQLGQHRENLARTQAIGVERQQELRDLAMDDPGRVDLQEQIDALNPVIEQFVGEINRLNAEIAQYTQEIADWDQIQGRMANTRARYPELAGQNRAQVLALQNDVQAKLDLINELLQKRQNVQTATNDLNASNADADTKKAAYDRLAAAPKEAPKKPTDGTFAVELKENVTQKPDSQTHIPLPFSKHALVIHHAKAVDAWSRSFMGIGETAVGYLGLINTLTIDGCERERICLDTVLFDPQLVALGKLIGQPVRFVLGGVGYVTSQLFEPEGMAYAVGNIGMMGVLTSAALFSFKQIEGTFLNWKAVPIISKENNGRPFIDGGMLLRDIGKFGIGVVCLMSAGGIVENMLQEDVASNTRSQ